MVETVMVVAVAVVYCCNKSLHTCMYVFLFTSSCTELGEV